MLRPDLKDEPYCSNCGYQLTGAVDSSKCPECGKPLVEVLTRNSQLSGNGKRYRSRATLFGLPVIDIAMGPKGTEMRGHARGIIAIGDVAVGFIALGGVAMGIVAIGGLALGFFALGGCAIGLGTAMGGGAIGTLAAGGAAIGILATGGGALGLLAQGGGAAGLYTRSTRALFGARAYPPVFDQYSWFFGPWPPNPAGAFRSMLVIVLITAIAAGIIGLLAYGALKRAAPPTGPRP